MKTVSVICFDSNVAAGVTRYASPFTTCSGWAADLNNRTFTVRDAGTYSDLGIRINSNAASSSSTFRISKNGSAGNLTMSISAGFTGRAEDTTNTDAVVATDTLTLEFINGGGGTISAQVAWLSFAATTNTRCRFGHSSTFDFNIASTTYYQGLCNFFGGSSTEALGQTKINTAGTLRNLFFRVPTNSRVNDTALISRINGSNGTLVGPTGGNISAGATGNFEDNTHTDTIAAGDLVGFAFTFGAGTETLRVNQFSVTLETTNNKQILTFGGGGPGTAELTMSAGVTAYTNFGGFNQSTTEADWKVYSRLVQTFSRLWVYISSNSSSTGNIILRKNGADSALVVPISSGATGELEDTTHTVSIAVGDEYNLKLENTGGGAIGIRNGSMLAETFDAPTLSSITPNTGEQGQQNLRLDLVGTGFSVGHGGNPPTIAISGTLVTIDGAVVVDSDTALHFNVDIDAGAAATARNVTVQTDLGTSGAQTFTVTVPSPDPPAVTSITPASGYANALVDVTFDNIDLVGTDLDGANPTINLPGAGWGAGASNITATSLDLSITVPAGTTPGTYNFTFETDDGESNSFGFTILSPTSGGGGPSNYNGGYAE